MCSYVRGPLAARSSSVGLAPTLRLPREDPLRPSLPCPRPPLSSESELCLTPPPLPPPPCPCTGIPLRSDRLLPGAPAPRRRGAADSPRIQRGARKPRGEGRERSQSWGTEPLALVHEVRGSVAGTPTSRSPAPRDGDTAQR